VLYRPAPADLKWPVRHEGDTEAWAVRMYNDAAERPPDLAVRVCAAAATCRDDRVPEPEPGPEPGPAS